MMKRRGRYRYAATFRPALISITVAVFAAFAACWLAARPVTAQSSGETESLRVVIKPLVPFVMVENDGYQGFSIDLWEEIARRINRAYRYQYVESVKQQLAYVEQGLAEIAITGISITKAREETVDFSLPYFRAGLQVMTQATGRQGLATPSSILASLVAAPEFITLIIFLVLVILVMGHIFWLTERRRNPEFPKSYFPGVWEGIWYTVVTMVTVGYGDKTARSMVGRLFAMLWMFASLFLVAGFTANITSQLTMSRFYGAIQGPEDLPGKVIATVDGSTAAQYLDTRRLPFVGVDVIEEAYALLEQGEVDAIVYDSPVLLYHVTGAGQGLVQVVGEVFEPQDYGIAFPSGSQIREQVNQTLLEIKEDGTYDQIYARWFESRTH